MVKNKKEEVAEVVEIKTDVKEIPLTTDLEWTDYVLSLLSDDEKIKGNPTTDGLRRVFEIALNCVVVQATTEMVQTPEPSNEKRATAVHSITYVLNPEAPGALVLNGSRIVSGSADVYWGNCDKIYRNHPVAVAETRAEGRALRRALKLRKVVAAEEIAEYIEDHPDKDSVSKITNNQINFIDAIAKRLNINVVKLLEHSGLSYKNIYDMPHEDAVTAIRSLSKHQQAIVDIPGDIMGYLNEWK